MREDKVKLPRSSYDELCRIIIAYGRAGKPASLDEISRLSTINTTAISANNSFLGSIGLIEGAKAKSATTLGQELAHALEHEIEKKVQRIWLEVVNENEFLTKMATAIKIRRKLEDSTFQTHIAYSAGETKSKAVMTGARTVVDILRVAGVVREEEGNLVAGEPIQIDSKDTEVKAGLEDTKVTAIAEGTQISATLNIELRIEVKPNELDGLGTKIRTLIEELRQASETDNLDANPD